MLLFFSMVALPSCGESESVQQPKQKDILWDTPDLPGPYAMTLDGVDVPDVVLKQFLIPDWNRYYITQVNQPGPVSEERLAEISAGFYSDPVKLLNPLIRDLLLVRRHEEDHGDVDAHAFEHFIEEFDANAGGTRDILIEQFGEEGLQEHLKRRFRLREMMKQFNASTESVTEAEIQAYFQSQYDRVLADMMANSSVSKEKAEEMLTLEDDRLREMIEGQLQLKRIEETVDQWILSIAEDTKVTFSGPDGAVVPIPVTARD